MKTITRKKPVEEIENLLGRAKKIALVGCGTCPAVTGTGGVEEVMEMSRVLSERGYEVMGERVISVACEPLPMEGRKDMESFLREPESILVLSCSLGVRSVSAYTPRPVLPALDTLFVGREEEPGVFVEECAQCGECVLGYFGGICPVVHCAKSLFNGPCGGSSGGKCEVDPRLPCGWQVIYDRMKDLGRLDELRRVFPVKDWSKSVSGGRRRLDLAETVRGVDEGGK